MYGLKQASRSWNIRFDQAIKSFGFDQCPDESCVYKKRNGNVVVFVLLYVDDILLIGNDVGVLSLVWLWLSSQFDMKDLGVAGHILGIKFLRDQAKDVGLLKLPISMRSLPVLACRIPRKDCFLSDTESIYPRISVLRHLRRWRK
ncbi:hypothetical protein C5H24_11490 [Xylella fastidiosa]|nr:hypothetical protein C5H24_11490 [Xylella fastidiosa]